MKPFHELTRPGRIRRLRRLASAALDAYGLAEARLTFVRLAGNAMFRVVESRPGLERPDQDLFAPGQYLLRVHQPGYQTPEAIALELEWLAALRREAGAPVPEPVPARSGELLVEASAPGVPEPRNCSLLRWLKGRRLTRGIGARHYQAQGRLMGLLHEHAAHWRPPRGAAKRRWDWEGLFGDGGQIELPAREAWQLLPADCHQPFRAVTRRVRRLMDRWGAGPRVYGLIHADLGVDANLLFWHGEARAIDFDDSGYGYWMYDLALSLEHCQEDPRFREYLAALRDGYTQVRTLPAEQWEQYDLFQAAFHVHEGLWSAAASRVYPHHRRELRERLDRAAKLVRGFVRGS